MTHAANPRRNSRLGTSISGRALSEAESGFLQAYFGATFDTAAIRVVASLGQRSWSPFGQRISLVRRHFRDQHPHNEIDLADPLSAAVFAHEAAHVWQRQCGRRVTWEAIPLQLGYTFAGRDPYRYETSADPELMLQRFLAANVEQQAKIVEDWVYRDRVGRSIESFAAIAAHVREVQAGLPVRK